MLRALLQLYPTITLQSNPPQNDVFFYIIIIGGMKVGTVEEWLREGSTPRNVMGMFELKNMQKAILNCLEKNNVMANLPTGFGKSLLFQYPASSCQGNSSTVIVVVPLRALLWDVMREARNLGIQAEEVDNAVINDYFMKDLLPQLLVVTPEKIFSSHSSVKEFLESLYAGNKIKLFVIDECHCVSQWGEDFRPDYLKLKQLIVAFMRVRFLAMSSTIAPESRVIISEALGLRRYFYFQASYNRPNLFYSVLKLEKKDSKPHAIINFLREKQLINQSGIIFCQTIKLAEMLYKEFENQPLSVEIFHSKLSQKARKEAYRKFMNQEVKVIIGTICFGMGINKSNIRFVINLGLSNSPENYYQESGRSGRDGNLAHCLLISFAGEELGKMFLFAKSTASLKAKKNKIRKYTQLKNYANTMECRKKVLFETLGEDFDDCQMQCDNCIEKRYLQERNFTEPCFQIIQSLQKQHLTFTKNQICSYLKGHKVTKKIRKKVSTIQFGIQVKGIFKKESDQTIEKIFDAMVTSSCIVSCVKKRKRFIIPYYKVGTKKEVKKCKKIIITEKKAQEKQISKEQKPKKVEFPINQMKQAKIIGDSFSKYCDFFEEISGPETKFEFLEEQLEAQEQIIENEVEAENFLQIVSEDEDPEDNKKYLQLSERQQERKKSIELIQIAKKKLAEKKKSIKRINFKDYSNQ